MYIRDRVDMLRGMLGAPDFPWEYTPNKEDFDNAHPRCGIDARGLLEMLEAIGREYDISGKKYIRHWVETIDDDVREYDIGISTTITSTYERIIGTKSSLGYEINHGHFVNWKWDIDNGEVISETGSNNINIIGFGVNTENVDEADIKISSTIRESYCTPVDDNDESVINMEGYDWVEESGAAYVIIIGDTTQNGDGGSETLTGDYSHGGVWEYDGYGGCSGSHHIMGGDPLGVRIDDFGEEIHPSGQIGDVVGSNYDKFIPIVSVDSQNESIKVSIPGIVSSWNNDSLKSYFNEMYLSATTFIDKYSDHMSIDHLKSKYDAFPHGDELGEVDWALGESEIQGRGKFQASSWAYAFYKKTQAPSSKWLLWTKTHLPPDWLTRLKA